MTDEQILEIADIYLLSPRLFESEDWSGDDKKLLKFARAMYDKGFGEGWKDCKVSHGIEKY